MSSPNCAAERSVVEDLVGGTDGEGSPRITPRTHRQSTQEKGFFQMRSQSQPKENSTPFFLLWPDRHWRPLLEQLLYPALILKDKKQSGQLCSTIRHLLESLQKHGGEASQLPAISTIYLLKTPTSLDNQAHKYLKTRKFQPSHSKLAHFLPNL